MVGLVRRGARAPLVVLRPCKHRVYAPLVCLSSVNKKKKKEEFLSIRYVQLHPRLARSRERVARRHCTWRSAQRMAQRGGRTLLALGVRVACCCIVWFGSSIAIICELGTRTLTPAPKHARLPSTRACRSARRRHEQVLSERAQLPLPAYRQLLHQHGHVSHRARLECGA
jgi:hypothetical protein